MSDLEFEHTARAKRIHALSYRLIERILSVMAVLGLACLCVGLVLHTSGKASNDLTVARIGAYMLVAGIMLMVPRFLYWIAVEIAERG